MLEMWVIYCRPSDHPDHYVARKWKGASATPVSYKALTLDGIRDMIPKGLYRQDRSPWDDPVIVEVWF